MDLEAVVDSLRGLERREAFRALTADYAYSLDDKDWEALGRVFAEDAVVETADGTLSGRQAIIDAYQEHSRVGYPGLTGRHFVVNHRFRDTANEDHLAAQCYYYATFRSAASEPTFGWGRYEITASFAGAIPEIVAMSFAVELRAM